MPSISAIINAAGTHYWRHNLTVNRCGHLNSASLDSRKSCSLHRGDGECTSSDNISNRMTQNSSLLNPDASIAALAGPPPISSYQSHCKFKKYLPPPAWSNIEPNRTNRNTKLTETEIGIPKYSLTSKPLVAN